MLPDDASRRHSLQPSAMEDDQYQQRLAPRPECTAASPIGVFQIGQGTYADAARAPWPHADDPGRRSISLNGIEHHHWCGDIALPLRHRQPDQRLWLLLAGNYFPSSLCLDLTSIAALSLENRRKQAPTQTHSSTFRLVHLNIDKGEPPPGRKMVVFLNGAGSGWFLGLLGSDGQPA